MPSPPVLPPHLRLLLQARSWHRWLGLGFLLPTLLLGVTGILLNHKELFFSAETKAAPSGLLTTGSTIQHLPLGFADALAQARQQWGEVPLERIELREEGGRLVYRVVPGQGRELQLDANGGGWRLKEGLLLTTAEGNGHAVRLDWKKLTGELHSGKIIGLAGRLLMDIAAVALVLLSLTGLYLWALPRWQRRRKSLVGLQ